MDLHFHGAFGIDLMTASHARLNELSAELYRHGVAGFCPTTLSAPPRELHEAVARLGTWIRAQRERLGKPGGARALGIHLEGPFISPHAAGAHPPGVIRPATLAELAALWEASQGTLKIITLAPESLDAGELRAVAKWARQNQVVLSAGHSRATAAQAEGAFAAGFRSVTHAWNAAGFHHREAGVLGAAMGRRDVFLELIIDGVHVDPTVVRWTRKIHAPDQICFVSDCAPAAGLPEGKTVAFGPLQIHQADGASRLLDGRLAGGGVLLPEAYRKWLAAEARATGLSAARLHTQAVRGLRQNPLKLLGLKPSSLDSRR